MKSIKSFGLFKEDENFIKVKRESIKEIMGDVNVQNFLSAYNLTQQDVEDNWVEFLEFYNDRHDCSSCKGLDHCVKDTKGFMKSLDYNDGSFTLSLTPCKYGKHIVDDNKILSNILIKNVNRKLLLTTTKDITIIKDKNSNVASVLEKLNDILKGNSKKGLYLYGKGGVGKSTLMGLAIHKLASKYECGFVHFPTLLLDIKASFKTYGDDNTLEALSRVDYLVIDDLGGENVTGWSRDEILYKILYDRIESNKITLFTSSFSLNELANLYILKKDEKVKVERLINMISALALPIELKGKDLR